MNKSTSLFSNLRKVLTPLRRKASGHHEVKKTSDTSNGFLSKYWDDKPMFPENVIYRNNYGTGGIHVPKKNITVANLAGGCLWCWILWHIWHDYGHITGHFYPPDPSQWTDEELGIPPDDVE
ncbi:hypothetical protein M8J76_013062 [Diaphorina citri]|nr:hypothetical protein M8J76_013062 [Diaphorina citri]KAI5725710.1 hypothetical protein M8J77_019185 [Diaphorina citri]